MSFRDLDIKHRGWSELRKANLFDSWEQVRTLAFYGLHQPCFALPKGANFHQRLQNPYKERQEFKGKNFTKKELSQRIKNLDKLVYKEYGK